MKSIKVGRIIASLVLILTVGHACASDVTATLMNKSSSGFTAFLHVGPGCSSAKYVLNPGTKATAVLSSLGDTTDCAATSLDVYLGSEGQYHRHLDLGAKGVLIDNFVTIAVINTPDGDITWEIVNQG